MHRLPCLLPTVNWGLCTAYCLLPTENWGLGTRLLPPPAGDCVTRIQIRSVTYLSKTPIPQLFAIRYSLLCSRHAPTYAAAKAPVGRIHYSLFTVHCSLFTTIFNF